MTQNDICKMYGGLRYTMKMSGIDLENSKSSIFLKPFKYLYIFAMHFYFVYFLCNYRISMEFSKSFFYENIACLIFSIVAWYLMKCKIVHLKKLITKMKSMKLYREFETLEKKIVNFTDIIIILLPIVFVGLDSYYGQNSEGLQKEMSMFNIEIESKLKKILLRSFLYSTYLITFYQFPIAATLFCCLLYYQLSASISHSCKKVNLHLRENFTCEYVIQFFHKLSRLIHLSKELDKIVSPISFFLLSLHVFNFFTLVAPVVKNYFSNMSIPSMVEFFATLIISVVGISSIIHFASLIEKRFLDIQSDLISMHEMYIHVPNRDNFTLELIRYMISMKLPVMTAWSVVALTPSLIFTLLSVCLTFGLLSTQIIR